MAEETDEEMALRLQREEDEAAARALQEQTGERIKSEALFQRKVASAAHAVLEYEREHAQEAARSAMPLERLRREAESAGGGEDELVKAMLRWFKREFFTWVDRPACPRAACLAAEKGGGGTKPKVIPRGRPNAEESQLRCGIVELYTCARCGGEIRFPRINDATALLRTRAGRCGEWANCFTLLLRAAGIEARHVVDWTDHVWAEYYSCKLNRWVHVDPCEEAWDTPLLYEQGWGKKLNYVVSCGRFGISDTTRRYTRQWEQVAARRTLIGEDELRRIIKQVTARLRQRSPLAIDVKTGIDEREKSEEEEMLGYSRSMLEGGEGIPGQSTAALPGRQTGTLEWRKSRGEMGSLDQTLRSSCLEMEDQHVALLARILERIVQEPESEKFRTLKVANPRVAALLEGPALAILEYLGFEKRGEDLVLPKQESMADVATSYEHLVSHGSSSTESPSLQKPSISAEGEFRARLHAEFARVQMENPALTANEAAALALSRLSIR